MDYVKIQFSHIWVVVQKLDWILNDVFYYFSKQSLLVISKTAFINLQENDFKVHMPQILLMLICMLIVFNVTRWHKGVQSSNGAVSSRFSGFSRTWKEVSSYLCTFIWNELWYSVIHQIYELFLISNILPIIGYYPGKSECLLFMN